MWQTAAQASHLPVVQSAFGPAVERPGNIAHMVSCEQESSPGDVAALNDAGRVTLADPTNADKMPAVGVSFEADRSPSYPPTCRSDPNGTGCRETLKLIVDDSLFTNQCGR